MDRRGGGPKELLEGSSQWCASGASPQNHSFWNQDKASAMLLLVPGIYFTEKDILASKQVKTNFHTSRITLSEHDVCLLMTTLTTLIVTPEQNFMVFEYVTTMENNSKKERSWRIPE